MNVLAVSNLLASLIIFAVGASVLLRDRTRRTYTSFAAFTFMVSAWYLCNFIAMATRQPLVEWLALWPAATIPPVALRFFREFLAEPGIGGERRASKVTLAWTLIAYLVLIYSAIFHKIHNSPWFLIPLGIYVYGSLYRCVLELYAEYRRTQSRVAKARIRYLMFGGLIAVTLAITDSLPRLGVAWPTLGNVLTILYLYFLSQTLFRYRLLDVHELLGKMVVLGTLVALLWAVYGLLLTWVGGGQEGLFLLNAVVASFFILILFEPVRTMLERLTNKWLVGERFELRGRMADVRRELSSSTDMADIIQRVIHALEESRSITHAAIYLIDAEGTGYELAGFYGPTRPAERIDAAQRKLFLDRVRQGFVNLESRRDGGQEEGREKIQETLTDLNLSLVVPIFGSADAEHGPWLLGFLGVRDERLEAAFDLDDVDVFRRLAEEIGSIIESQHVFERVKERDRLAAVGEMAAGLAHEIRNPLGAIKGAAQLLVGPDGKPLSMNEGTPEFLNIIIDEVNRLNNVVTRFLDYARPQKSDPEAATTLDVNQLVKKTVQLLETYDAAANVTFDIRLDELLPAVAGDPEQLRQVFLNLGLNALQSMENGGTLEIITTRRRRSRLGYGSFAEIRFRDSGVGIPRESIRNLFIPFFTTKARGTGLGLAISQRIVSQHGGSIEVRSHPGKGSTFSVFLPAVGTALEHGESKDQVTQKLVGGRDG